MATASSTTLELLRRLEARFGQDEGEKVWHDALWRNDPDTSTVIPNADASPAPEVLIAPPVHPSDAQRDLPSPPNVDLGADGALIKSLVAELGLPKTGSYAVAVSPSKTDNGHAMFLGAPQSGISAPPVMWEVGLQAPGIDCGGGAVPGAGPFLILGRCKSHAWTIVSGNAGDTVDDVVENRTGAGYSVDGTETPFEQRTEHFLIRTTNIADFASFDPSNPTLQTQFDELDKTFLRTRHGPVFATDDNHAWAREYSQQGHEIDNLASLFDLTAAQTLDEAVLQLKKVRGRFTSPTRTKSATSRTGSLGGTPCTRTDSIRGFPLRARPRRTGPRSSRRTRTRMCGTRSKDFSR